MAERFIPKSPRPTRAQIDDVFKDSDFARKVEKIFDDLINAAEAANANAAQIEIQQSSRPAESSAVSSLASRIEGLEIRIDAAERRARSYEGLARRVDELMYLIAGA
jgi:hypothetical protein